MRRHHKKIGQSVEGRYVYLVAGQGVVKNGDTFGGDTERGELIFEGSADSNQVVGAVQAPTVELVVEPLFEIGGGVAVVESDPGVGPIESAAGNEEVGFDVMRLDDVGGEGMDELTDFGEERGVEGA